MSQISLVKIVNPRKQEAVDHFPEYSPVGKLTELDSQILGQESSPSFLSPNNTVLLAHQGSAVTLSCRLNNTPYFGMVNNEKTENLKPLQTSHKEHLQH